MIDAGTLYIVATPIGNLDDISRRAVEVLSGVDLIAAEDTRHSQKLLQSVQVSTPVVSHHDFSADSAIERILDKLESGASVALISDAGTPLISDPGYKLVSLARQKNLSVIPIPGASALISALSVSGLATDRFSFEGFLPSKGQARRKRLAALAGEQRTMVFYESTHRIVESIRDMSQVFEEQRLLFIGRELTKRFESHFLGTAQACIDWLDADTNQQKGEFVVIVAGADEQLEEVRRHEQAMDIVRLLSSEVSMKKAVSLASEISGARKNLLYEAALKERADAED
ncbi:MAG: ribosomal RNA small subunit methyltransferase I [Pseudohongiella sp.]|nr:MAG: ribosomal RNA small subunit methyltransferase I [Pseudohongiella sp.]